MAAFASTPRLPDVPLPPAVPTVDDAAARQSQEDVMKARKGRASTIATGSSGLLTAPTTGSAKLLGG